MVNAPLGAITHNRTDVLRRTAQTLPESTRIATSEQKLVLIRSKNEGLDKNMEGPNDPQSGGPGVDLMEVGGSWGIPVATLMVLGTQ